MTETQQSKTATIGMKTGNKECLQTKLLNLKLVRKKCADDVECKEKYRNEPDVLKQIVFTHAHAKFSQNGKTKGYDLTFGEVGPGCHEFSPNPGTWSFSDGAKFPQSCYFDFAINNEPFSRCGCILLPNTVSCRDTLVDGEWK